MIITHKLNNPDAVIIVMIPVKAFCLSRDTRQVKKESHGIAQRQHAPHGQVGQIAGVLLGYIMIRNERVKRITIVIHRTHDMYITLALTLSHCFARQCQYVLIWIWVRQSQINH